MAVLTGDLKLFFSDVSGNIDLTNEFQDLAGTFDPVLDIDPDVPIKMHVKNTNSTDTAERIVFYIVNGMTATNTNNTPISTTLNLLYSHITPIGDYSLTFPDTNNVIVTPPGGSARDPQSILYKDDATPTPIYLQDNLPVMIVFSSGLTAADTAKININDGGSYIQAALDVAGSPGTYTASPNSFDTGISIGTLTAGQSKAIWLNQSVPDGVTNALNNRKWRPIIRGAAA